MAEGGSLWINDERVVEEEVLSSERLERSSTTLRACARDGQSRLPGRRASGCEACSATLSQLCRHCKGRERNRHPRVRVLGGEDLARPGGACRDAVVGRRAADLLRDGAACVWLGGLVRALLYGPVEDVVVLEPFADEQVAEELAQVRVVWLVVEPERAAVWSVRWISLLKYKGRRDRAAQLR